MNKSVGVVLLTALLCGAAAAEDHRPAIEAAGHVPLSFEQASSGNTRWTARGNGYRLTLGPTNVEVGLNAEQLRILFAGANDKAISTGLDTLPGKVNYLIGRDPKVWLRDIPTYGKVRYKDVYPGVDVVWYGNQGRLEYDLELQPGADPSQIAMRFDGTHKLSVDANGDLRVEMTAGSLSLKLPVVYQETGSGRKRISSTYDLRANNEVAFRLGAYDKTHPLVIDPTLVYATYFGTGASPDLLPWSVAVDASGNVFMAGWAQPGRIPTLNALQPGNLGQTDAFISKFDPSGKTLLYSTYLGGSMTEYMYGIAVDPSGNLVGVGSTQSADFPLVNPAQSAFTPSSSMFAFRLNPTGDQLVYSTYLGNNTGFAVALDPSGNAYFTGSAIGLQATPGALNTCCAFVTKLSATGSLLYSAKIRGSIGRAIVVDTQGAAYVTGGDFVGKLTPDATSLVWATSLGGTADGYAIALGPGNQVYVGGQVSSADLPVTSGVVQPTYGGGTDAFVASLSADGTSFLWVTYLGGAKDEFLRSLATSPGGLIVAGSTSSSDFPVANAIQPTMPGSSHSFFRSTNSGATLVPVDSGLPAFDSFNGGYILPDPSSPGTLLLDIADKGVYRSADDGATWMNVESYTGGSTARSLSNPSILYSATYCQLWKSTDGGQTWNSIHPNCQNYGTAIAVSPTDPNTVLLFYINEEFRSTDGGLNFQSLSTLLPFSIPNSDFSSRIVSSPDGSLYVATQRYGLSKTTDAGLTWANLGSGVLPSRLPGFAVSTSNPSILYASDGNNVYKSTNAGTSWTTVGQGAGVVYLAVDPSNPERIYGSSSSNDGVLISTDGGATWTATGALLDSSQILDLAVSPSNAAEVYLSNYVPLSGFVGKLSTDGKTMQWATFYGAYDATVIGGAAVAPSGDTWVVGNVTAESLPLTPDARNANTHASGSAFLARISDATAACSYTVNPSTQYSYSAERLVFSVTAPSGCAWTATPSDNWIHLIRTSGIGSGPIPLAVDANTTPNTRTGTVTVNGMIYTIIQAAATCTYQLTTSPLAATGGAATVTVTAPTGCPWEVELQTSDPAAITSPATGTGNGTVTVSIPPNAGASGLSYGLQIGSSSTSIEQADPCTYSLPMGSNFAVAADASGSNVPVVSSLNGCAPNPVSDQPWLTAYVFAPSNIIPNTLNFYVTQNDTGADRIGHITIGNQQLTVTQAFTSAQFADVPPSASFFDAANLMFQAGVTTGCVPSSDPSTRMFCPNNSVTRQEVAAFIVRAVTGTTTPALYNPVAYFTDVPATNPFFAHIQKLEELAITTGCGPGLFCPTNTVTRWEAAIFMVRARLTLNGAGFTFNPTPYFADVPTNIEGNSQPFPFIQRSYEEHITNGCGTNPLVYCPDDLVSRAEMASFIMRALFNETTILGPTSPVVTRVFPITMASTPATQLAVTIIGANTNFQVGDTVNVPSGMLDVSNVQVTSSTSITARLTTNATTVAGPQTLIVTSAGQNLTLPLAIKVGTY